MFSIGSLQTVFILGFGLQVYRELGGHPVKPGPFGKNGKDETGAGNGRLGKGPKPVSPTSLMRKSHDGRPSGQQEENRPAFLSASSAFEHVHHPRSSCHPPR